MQFAYNVEKLMEISKQRLVFKLFVLKHFVDFLPFSKRGN